MERAWDREGKGGESSRDRQGMAGPHESCSEGRQGAPAPRVNPKAMEGRAGLREKK